MVKNTVFFRLLLIFAIASLACNTLNQDPGQVSQENNNNEASEPDEPPPPTNTPVPRDTPAPTETPAPTATTAITITTPVTTTTILTTTAAAPDSGLLTQRIPDGSDDSVDCQFTLAPTDQDLLFDIAETGWSLEGDEVTFFLKFDGLLDPSLETIGNEDFLGVGWGVLDPQSEIYSNPDPSWLANVAANKSFDAAYDTEKGSFDGALFLVKNAEWIQAEDVVYPVTTGGNVISMTVPVTDVPPNARGFATVVHFNAEEGQLNCDWAGIDENAFQKIIEDLTGLSESVEPPRLTIAYTLELPGAAIADGDGTTAVPPSIGGTYAVTTTAISGLVHEFAVNLDPVLDLVISPDSIVTDTIHFQGQGNWVDVEGPIGLDGTFFASGSGIVAGIPNVDATLSGIITDDSLIAEYILGDSGILPTGESIVYDVTGTRRLEGSVADYSTSVGTFLVDFNTAFLNKDEVFLYEHLHPAVIELYGAEGCQNYLEDVVDNPISVQSLDMSGPENWIWQRDGREMPIEDAFIINALVSSSGQSQEQELHVAAIGETIRWFTDCGDPLP